MTGPDSYFPIADGVVRELLVIPANDDAAVYKCVSEALHKRDLDWVDACSRHNQSAELVAANVRIKTLERQVSDLQYTNKKIHRRAQRIESKFRRWRALLADLSGDVRS
jgi:chaperonin cofactor prefoldin